MLDNKFARRTTWFRLTKLALFLLLGLIATACGGDQVEGVSTDSVIKGPAFILFFTDP